VLFGFSPDKAAWPRHESQASKFGGLGLKLLPGRPLTKQSCASTPGWGEVGPLLGRKVENVCFEMNS